MMMVDRERVRDVKEKNALDLCYWYTNDSYPDFKPVCRKGYKASLSCHEKTNCPEYKPSIIPYCSSKSVEEKLDK